MTDLELMLGDSLKVLPTLGANSVDAVVTDPPAGITMLGAEWDHFDAPGVIAHNDFKAGATGEAHSHGLAGVLQSKGAVEARAPFISFIGEVFREVFRVLKPGGYGLVWALPRTSHWTAMGLEDSGLQILDVITHHYSNGYPKTANSLKPASEHWLLVRKPPEGTIAANEEKWNVGSLGIDECRPTSGEGIEGRHPANLVFTHSPECVRLGVRRFKYQKTVARPPDPKIQTGWGHQRQDGLVRHPTDADGFEEIEEWKCGASCTLLALNEQFAGEGGAARFFPVFQVDPDVDFRYVPKANTEEKHAGTNSLYWKRGEASTWSPATFVEYAELRRLEDEQNSATPGKSVVLCGRGNIHPTSKSIGLMRWLVRLVTPPGGLVLDCFMGSGTTSLACYLEKRRFIGIEKEECYHTIAKSRLAALQERQKLAARLQEPPAPAKAPVPTEAVEAAPAPAIPPEPEKIPGLSLTADRFKKLVKKAAKK